MNILQIKVKISKNILYLNLNKKIQIFNYKINAFFNDIFKNFQKLS